LRNAVVSRSRSAGAEVLRHARDRAPEDALLDVVAVFASSCGSTFSMSTRGSTMPARMPSRMLRMAWSKITGNARRGCSQSS
jgi:hypothetical protein